MSVFKAIAAMSLNRVIGNGLEIPWHLPEDFKWFKQTTMGQVLVMGRRTFDSIGRALPGRETMVLTRGDFSHPDVTVIRSLDEVAPRLKGRTAFIAGGAAPPGVRGSSSRRRGSTAARTRPRPRRMYEADNAPSHALASSGFVSFLFRLRGLKRKGPGIACSC